MAAGGKGRKIGRNKRKPANIAYLGEHRWERNAKRRAARHSRRMERQERRVRERAMRGKFRKNIGDNHPLRALAP